MGSNPIPKKTLSDESINRGLVCAHMHFIARTQKILTFMSSTGECQQQKHTQHAPSTKTECDYLNGWIKRRSHLQKSHSEVVNPRDIAGERKKNLGRFFSRVGYVSLLAPLRGRSSLKWLQCWLQIDPQSLIHRPPRLPCGKASTSRAEDPGIESRLRREFFGVESYQWLKTWHSSGYPARRLAL